MRSLLLIYKILMALLLPVLIIRLLIRSIGDSSYRLNLPERLAFFSHDTSADIWIQAVSLGEVRASAELVESLLKAFPKSKVLITSTTPSGSTEVRRLFGDRVKHCLMPYDSTLVVRSALSQICPKAVILMETEIWPVLLDELSKRGIPSFLVNGRMSSKSAHGYLLFSALTRYLFGYLDTVYAQYESDRDNFISLGVHPKSVRLMGNLKFDSSLPRDLPERVRNIEERFQKKIELSWIAASTRDGEERKILQAHRSLLEKFPHLLLFLAPRHVERVREVEELIRRFKLRPVLLSEMGQQSHEEGTVFLIDRVGILFEIYSLADVAFVGGSLVPSGGQNPIEPALLEKPILYGPHRRNFLEVTSRLESGGGLLFVNNEAELEQELSHLLSNDVLRYQIAARAKESADEESGSLARLKDSLFGKLGQLNIN